MTGGPGARHQGLPRETKRHKTMNLTRNYKSVALAIAGVLLFPSCASIGNAKAKAQNGNGPELAVKSVQHGKASWYSIRTNRGTRTASGQRLCDKGSTAAHKTLPMGTKVRVTNQANGKSEIVTINDRGPYIRGRVIDVTIGTAERLGFRQRGVAPVKVEVLGRFDTSR
jgi:rare lipoprotein A